MTFRPRRSALYMPGSNTRALEKARQLPADVLILDLEDAVAPDAKDLARDHVCAAVRARGFGQREVVIRVNGMTTPWGAADLEAAAAAGPDAILVPKVSDPVDLAHVHTALDSAQAADSLRVWAMMETPLAMLNALPIAASAKDNGSRLSCLVMGTNDLAKETRAALTADRLPMLSWLSTCIAAARAFGLDILDGVFNDFRNDAGLRRESEQGVQLGMDGKTLIHPDQVAAANELFQPSAADVAHGRAIIAAFDLPENSGKGVITLNGRMVELLHRDMAIRLVAIADAIATSTRGGGT